MSENVFPGKLASIFLLVVALGSCSSDASVYGQAVSDKSDTSSAVPKTTQPIAPQTTHAEDTIRSKKEIAMGFLALGTQPTDPPHVRPIAVDLFFQTGARRLRMDCMYVDGRFILLGDPSVYAYAIFTINSIQSVEPPNYSAFYAELTKLMKDHPEIEYWQIGNEPDLAWPNNLVQFISFFTKTSEFIRNECRSAHRNCKIVLPGISNQYDTGSRSHTYFKALLASLKTVTPIPFDVFDLHLFLDDEQYGKAKTAINTYKQLLADTGFGKDTEMIATELGAYSGTPYLLPFLLNQTEESQAKMLIKLHTLLFAGGITQVYWMSVINFHAFGNGGTPGGLFDFIGLAYNGLGRYDVVNRIQTGTKKKSFYAYQALASKVQTLSFVSEAGSNIYKFGDGTKVVYIAWDDSGSAKLPASIRGSVKVTDYLNNTQTQAAESITLSSSPIFISF